MDAGTLVLLHSPLVGVASWGALPEALGRAGAGAGAVAVPVSGDDQPPFGRRYVDEAVAGILAATASQAGPPVLVGHSGAGPLLGAVGAGLAARGEPAGGYLFCDAGLPADGATRLDLLAAENPEMATAFRAELERGGRFPEWGDADLAPLVPDPAARAALIGSLRPRDLAFFTEPLPPAPGWPAASLDAGHFHPLADPGGVAAALLGVLARM